MVHNSILFDIGATKTRMAYISGGQTFEEPMVWSTPEEYADILKMLSENAKALAKDRPIETFCGGMTRSAADGDYDRLKSDLGEAFGAKVFLENDAAMAGLGEADFGAGKGFEIVSYITVSTGVGGARIVGGKIDENASGFEPGKQIINADTGETLEDMISGKSLEEKTGSHPKDIADQSIWNDLADKLAIGLNNIIVEWSPSCVVLGGSMITGNPAIPLEKARERLKEILKIFPEIPSIKKAELGDFGGLYGAISLLNNL